MTTVAATVEQYKLQHNLKQAPDFYMYLCVKTYTVEDVSYLLEF